MKNRLCENLLVSAEKFAAIAFLYGAKYPEKALDKSWRQLLCAQHHDSITGTNNEISFVDLMIEYRESASLAYEVLMNSARYIASIADDMKKIGEVYLYLIISDKEVGPFKTTEQAAHYVHKNNIVNYSASKVLTRNEIDVTSIVREYIRELDKKETNEKYLERANSRRY